MGQMADEFAQAYIERLEYLKQQPNTFYFDEQDNLILVPKDEENMRKLQGFVDNMKKNIRSRS
jgi:hypothetical protein